MRLSLRDENKSAPIILSEIQEGKFSIGVITINRPKNLNALNTECYKIINPQLLAWENDPQMAMVVIRSENEKSFCAGGDVKDLILGIRSEGLIYAKDFFTEEYFCDGILSSYKKPVLCLAQGIVFGGGMGLFMASSHRVVDTATQWAMPETAIGLFPDVAGTHFLSWWPENFGLFLGLTGTRFGVSEADLAAIITAQMPFSEHDDLLHKLSQLHWHNSPVVNHNILSHYLKKIKETEIGKSTKPLAIDQRKNDELLTEFKKYFPKDMHTVSNWEKWDVAIRNSTFENPILKEGQLRYFKASPHAAQVFYHAYFKHKNLTPIETLINEWEMAIEFSRTSDFDEGVRALLIDKDQSPHWMMNAKNKIIPDEEMKRFFHRGSENLLTQKFREFGR